MLLPAIRSVNCTALSDPLKVRIVKNEKLQIWWQVEPANSDIAVTPRAHEIRITEPFEVVDNFNSYVFASCLYNVLLVNKLRLGEAAKVVTTKSPDNARYHFIYYVDVMDGYITIPSLPRHSGRYRIVFRTSDIGEPILDISVSIHA